MRVVERRRGVSVVWGAVKGEMLINGNSTGIEEVSSPCIAALLVCFTGGAKSLDNFIRGNNAKWRGRFIRMSSRGSVRQIEENVSSSDKFRGGEIRKDSKATRRVEQREYRERGAQRKSEVGVREYRQDREDPEREK